MLTNRRRQLWQAMLLALLVPVLLIDTVPALRASALYLLADGGTTAAVESGVELTADRVIVVGAEDGAAELALEGGHKVTVTHDGSEQYATTREDETVTALLKRMDIAVGAMEMVKVDVS